MYVGLCAALQGIDCPVGVSATGVVVSMELAVAGQDNAIDRTERGAGGREVVNFRVPAGGGDFKDGSAIARSRCIAPRAIEVPVTTGGKRRRGAEAVSRLDVLVDAGRCDAVNIAAIAATSRAVWLPLAPTTGTVRGVKSLFVAVKS